MRQIDMATILSNGWFRLWVVAVAALLSTLLALAAYALLGQDVCYRYVSISSIDKLSTEDQILITGLRKESETRTFCGPTEYSMLFTLEELAKRGVVTQVGLQWQEPKGWSFNDFETLDVLNGKEIRASLIQNRVNRYVRNARLQSFIPWLAIVSAISVGALLLGFGIAWIRGAFAKKDTP